MEKGDENLEPAKKIDSFNVANIILAEISTEPKKLNEEAQNAAKARWKDFADEVRSRPEVSRIITSEIWESQDSDVIECYAAWVPMGNDYQADRKRLMRLLAGRKAIRNFKKPEKSWPVEKSSLDGARETVLKNRKSMPKWLSMQLRLTEGEELCAVGLTKRLGWGTVPFPSVTPDCSGPLDQGCMSDTSQR